MEPQDHNYQPITDIAEIAHKHQIKHIIMSPGSRCAPLTLAFSRHPQLLAKTVSDERSAAFIALGLAQSVRQPVILLCTSGTAGLNYAPAVAEAFYQNVPLVVITADRPPEWVDQQDGQTIRQQNLYGPHVKGFFQLPADYAHPDAQWHIARVVSEAINLSKSQPQGPVHINAPFREPFYPKENQTMRFSANVKTIQETEGIRSLPENTLEELRVKWAGFNRKLIVVGQNDMNKGLAEDLAALNVPVVADVTANAQKIPNSIRRQDLFLNPEIQGLKDYQPDLVVSIGGGLVSKNLRLFLRKNKPAEHWHVQPAGPAADVYQALTKIVRVEPQYFVRNVCLKQPVKQGDSFTEKWRSTDQKALRYVNAFFQSRPHNEFSAIRTVLKNLPDNTIVHLANSMSVRYVNFLNHLPPNTQVYSNRGTSGIDGSSSTAVGHSLGKSTNTHLLITGDMAFFYDRNAFWNKYVKNNLRVLLLNNGGGGIFGMLPGPSAQKELKEFFETEQPLNAKHLCAEYGFGYLPAYKTEEVNGFAQNFFLPSNKSLVMEVFTDPAANKENFLEFKNGFRELK